MSAVVAALSKQKEHLKHRDLERAPRLELEEIKAELDDKDVGNEVAYLRDAGVVSTETFQDETVMVKLNPEIAGFAADIKDFMYEEFNGSVRALAASEEYLDFQAPNGWPEWNGPDLNEGIDKKINYEKYLGPLCAVLSIYGEDRLNGADRTEYSVEGMEEAFSFEGYEVRLDIERQMEILEQLGYLERYKSGSRGVYRLSDDEEVKIDARQIAEFRNKIFSGQPQNLALAYEEADRLELEEKGVKLVQRPRETK